MEESILNSTKKLLNIDSSYDEFDVDIITHINATLSVLNQLGVGALTGFMITGAEETWTDFLGTDKRLNLVRSYMALKVRYLFDPPTGSGFGEALKQQIDEAEWRINIFVDNGSTISPIPPIQQPGQVTEQWVISKIEELLGQLPPVALSGSYLDLTDIPDVSSGTSIHVGPTPPDDTSLLWVDTSGGSEALVDGGTPSTSIFALTIDGGSPSDTSVDATYDG